MTLQQAIQNRESCRAYASTPVEKDKLHRVLQAALLAPSAGNGQPWRYQVVTNPKLLKQLAPLTQITGLNGFASQAPCIIAVWEHMQPRLVERYGEAYIKWPPVDIGLSVSQLCLTATQEGLGTCIMGVFDEARCLELLPVPENATLKLLIALGYPKDAKPPRAKKRLPLEQVVHFLEE